MQKLPHRLIRAKVPCVCLCSRKHCKRLSRQPEMIGRAERETGQLRRSHPFTSEELLSSFILISTVSLSEELREQGPKLAGEFYLPFLFHKLKVHEDTLYNRV